MFTWAKKWVLYSGILMLSLMTQAQAHCQVPCGIYDDHMRVKTMLEDVATTEKAVKMMEQLSAKSDIQSQNQMVRWVMTKEQHAQKVIDTISDYFLTQRVKPKQVDYPTRLAKHHKVILAAMKVKQQADMTAVTALHDSVMALAPYYPEHKH